MISIGFDGYPLGGFKGALEKLQTMHAVRSFELVEEKLQAVSHTVQMINLVRELGYQERPSLKTLACQFSDVAYAETAEEMILDEIPHFDNMEEDGYINPEPLGLNGYTYDEAEDILSAPDGQYYGTLLSFLLFIVGGFEDEELWRNNQAVFDWPFDEMVTFETSIWKLNEERVRAYLVEHNCECLLGAVEYAIFPPDNRFFDIQPEEDNSVEFTAENILELKRDYDEIKPVMDRYNFACRCVAEDPKLLLTLVEALRFGEPERTRVRP